jgi:S-adenosyl-L-methionine hydrolase (adenosine-forming)
MRRIAPEADVVDITHGIAPGDVLRGALALADALPYMPVGVHAAVVDPGVGTARRALALAGGDGRIYVGPDNGLLLLAPERLGGVRQAVEITEGKYLLSPVSATFHGRDVFAPAAAHLALGVPLEGLGPALDPTALARVDVPKPRVEGGAVHASVVDVDRFGNVALGASVAELGPATIGGRGVTIEIAEARHEAARGSTFADVPAGDLLLFEDASGRAALAVNGGSAANLLAVQPGSVLVVRKA